MSEVRVRNLDENVVAELKARARRAGISLEATLREILRQEAFRPRRELASKLEKFHAELEAKHGLLPDSTPGIREERDRIG